MTDDRRAPDRSEADLVDAARSGDRAAFDHLIDRHAATIWRAAWGIVRGSRDAEDVVKETILAAWRTLPAYTGELPYAAWLLRTGVARAIKTVERAEDVGRTPGPSAAGPPVDLGALEPAELARRVAACRLRMPPAQRAVLTLRDREAMDWDAIEQTLSLPAGTARSRAARARFALWRCVSGAADARRIDRRVEDQVSALLDGDLDTADLAAVERRLGADPSLSGLLADLRALQRAVDGDQPPPLPSALLERVRGELPEGEASPRRRRPVPSPAAAPVPVDDALPFPFGKVIVGLVVLGLLAGAAFFLVEMQAGQRLWSALRARLAPPAEAPAAPGEAPALPQPAGEPSAGRGADPGLAAASPAPAGAAPESTTDATAEPPVGPTESAGEVPSQAPPSVPADATPEAGVRPAAPPAPVPGSTINGCWNAARGMLRWAGAPPENPARTLGGIALKSDGKAYLDDVPPRVRILVPRERIGALLAGLRAAGVDAPAFAEPPPDATCAAVVVDAPGQPSPAAQVPAPR